MNVRFSRVGVSLLMWAAILFTLFPVFNAVEANHTAAVAVLPPITPAQLDAADDYNRQLTPDGLSDPWTDAQAANSQAHDEYLSQLESGSPTVFAGSATTSPRGTPTGAGWDEYNPDDPGSGVLKSGPLGRLRIPAISVNLPINHDATRASMFNGVGHMYGTSLPVGGPSTHAVLAGHTGSKRRVFLDRMVELKPGQSFFIDVGQRTLTYQVDQIHVVAPTDLSLIRPVAGDDLVTLVTCHPGPGGANWRLLVRGHRAEPRTASGGQPSPTVRTRAALLPVDVSAWEQAWSASQVDWVVKRELTALGLFVIWLAMVASWARRESEGS